MSLQNKTLMPPPWLAYRHIECCSIGWRMGYGEYYLDQFLDWFDSLSNEEQSEYRNLFPEPLTWKGWWDKELSDDGLEHGGFFVNTWQPQGKPKYNLKWLQQEFAQGNTKEMCHFWGNQPSKNGRLPKAASASGGSKTSVPDHILSFMLSSIWWRAKLGSLAMMKS